jgi:hypothetical protein
MWPVAWTARGDGASLFKDRCVRVTLVLVHEQQVAKMPFAEHGNMVDALAADRAYQPFRISILPGDRGDIGRSLIPWVRRRRGTSSP